MRKLLLVTCMVACFCHANGQEVLVTLRDSVRFKTELIRIENQYLKTQAGTVGLREVFSIRFNTAEDFNKDPNLAQQLLRTEINIYVSSKKMESVIVPKEEKVVEQLKPIPVTQASVKEMVAALGVGYGLDYGGVGARLTYLIDKHVGLFGGLGYTSAGVGFNAGAIGRLNPEKKFTPTLAAMYGYNGIYSTLGRRRGFGGRSNQFYYGPSIALGLESKVGRFRKNYFHFQIVIPFRASSAIIPNLVSVGYNFILKE